VGLPAYTPSPWQALQGVVVCAPVSGNWVVLWLNVPPVQVVVVWQLVHVVANPAAACGGLLVLPQVSKILPIFKHCSHWLQHGLIL